MGRESLPRFPEPLSDEQKALYRQTGGSDRAVAEFRQLIEDGCAVLEEEGATTAAKIGGLILVLSKMNEIVSACDGD